MLVRELIELLLKEDQDRLIELVPGGSGYYCDPHTVRRHGDVVLIVSKPEDDNE